MAILCRNFYTGNTVDIARSLVGCYLVRRYEGELLVCRITETEAYVGAIDKAAHSYGSILPDKVPFHGTFSRHGRA